MRSLERIVVVGASLAGLRAAQALREEGYEGHLTVMGEEAHRPYNRPPLSKQVLLGGVEPSDLLLPIDEARLEVDWHLGTKAVGLDVAGGQVWTDDGRPIAFDGLVLATGAAARIPPLEGIDGDDVFKIRTLSDAISLRHRLAMARRVVVVGAGFIGCEVAATARQMGKDVWLIDAGTQPMSRVLPPVLSGFFATLHASAGVNVMLGRRVCRFVQGARSTRVDLDDGDALDADVVVIGLGSIPNTAWLRGSGLGIADGVLCDSSCRVMGTGGMAVAAGDIVRWPHVGLGGRSLRVEHWNQAAEQAAVAARALLDPGYHVPYAPVLSLWSDQYQKKLQVLGAACEAEHVELVSGSLEEGKYMVECYQGGELIGAVAYGHPAKMPALRRRLEDAMQAKVAALGSSLFEAVTP